jgi:hypothetical protein
MKNFQVVHFAELFARFFQNALFNNRFVADEKNKTNLAAVFFNRFRDLGDIRVNGGVPNSKTGSTAAIVR